MCQFRTKLRPVTSTSLGASFFTTLHHPPPGQHPDSPIGGAHYPTSLPRYRNHMRQHTCTSNALFFEHSKVLGSPSLIHALLKPGLIADLLGEERKSLPGKAKHDRQDSRAALVRRTPCLEDGVVLQFPKVKDLFKNVFTEMAEKYVWFLPKRENANGQTSFGGMVFIAHMATTIGGEPSPPGISPGLGCFGASGHQPASSYLRPWW